MSDFFHIIEKVFVEVNTGSLDSANYLKNNIGRFLEAEVFPKIEQMLDGVNQTGRVVRIDSLNLDVATPRKDIFKFLTAEISGKFSEKLEMQLKINSNGTGIGTAMEFASKNIQILSDKEKHEDVLLFFLQNGYLPWYGKKADINTFLEFPEWKKALEKASFVSRLTEILKSDDLIFQRFVYQLNKKNVFSFFTKTNPEFKITESVVLGLLKQMDAELSYSFLKTLFYKYVHTDFRSFNDALIDLQKIIEIKFYKKSADTGEIKKSEIHISDEKTKNILTGLTLFFDKIKIVPGGKTDEFTVFIKALHDNIIADKSVDLSQNGERAGIVSKIEKEISGAEIKDNYKPEEFTENKEIALQNAGLILIYPFLKIFLQTNGFLNEKGRIKNSELSKAVQTLHFIATGNEDFFEANLVFEKFLCGMPLKMPLERESLLSEEIKNESLELLNEIIRQWPALKNTSSDGLRQMFFIRNGKLIFEDENIRLIVERKAQDILLDRLNWSISIVKIPWIDALIHVEW